MATGGDVTLKDSEIDALAREMEARKLESIAITDLGITVETVNNLRVICQNDFVGFNRDILILWRNKNPMINQVQVRPKRNSIVNSSQLLGSVAMAQCCSALTNVRPE